jgi:hypothetical protein
MYSRSYTVIGIKQIVTNWIVSRGIVLHYQHTTVSLFVSQSIFVAVRVLLGINDFPMVQLSTPDPTEGKLVSSNQRSTTSSLHDPHAIIRQDYHVLAGMIEYGKSILENRSGRQDRVGIVEAAETGRLCLAKQMSQDMMETRHGTHIDLDLASHRIQSSGFVRGDTGDIGERLITLVPGFASSPKRRGYRAPAFVRRLGRKSRAVVCMAYTCSLMVHQKFGVR